MNLLLESFWESYGFLIILLVLFVAYIAWMMLKNKKDREAINNFQTNLKIGDKVVTGSGIYGTVEKIVDTTDGKVVTLKVGENSYIDVNIGAIYNIDSKTEVKDEPIKDEPAKEESAEETSDVAEDAEDKAEVVDAEVAKEQKSKE
ncbi:MAG: preprotein translocase subunit YajC [Christensenellales bacterium]